jgi:hypothetical protein
MSDDCGFLLSSYPHALTRELRGRETFGCAIKMPTAIAQAKSALTSRRFVMALAVCVAFAGPVPAHERQSETVPQVDAYFKLSEEFRLYTSASLTQSVSEGTSDGGAGVFLDLLTFTPIILDALLDQLDSERNRYLWGRIGVTVSGIHEGFALSNGFSEKSLVIEANGRYPLSSEFWVVFRARTDLRELNGDRSNLYRVRLGVEKSYSVLRMTMIPYARAEFFYDTRFNAVSREIYQTGVEVRLNQRFRIEPYYAFQNDSRTSPARLDRFGLVLKYYN